MEIETTPQKYEFIFFLSHLHPNKDYWQWAEDHGYVIKEVGFPISPPLRVCHHQHPSWCLPRAQIVLINCVYCMFDRSETEAGFQMFSS